jgi:hypothetical protein
MKTKAEIDEMDAARAGENVIWDAEADCYIERKDDRRWYGSHKYLYVQGIPPREIRCKDCGTQKKLEFHHEDAFSKGGTNERSNIVILCKKCHCKAENRKYNPYYSVLDRMAAEDISYREAVRETKRKYSQTEAGKKARREYYQTEAGKESKKKAQRKYRLKQKESKAKEMIA